MSVSSRAVTVTTTATRLDSTSDHGTPHGSNGQAFTFHNGSAVTVYMGGSDVTTANGAPVAASSWAPGMDLTSGDIVYGIVATGTAEVRVLEVGV